MLAKLDLNQRWVTDTKLFVREPVIDFYKRIKDNSNRIILNGSGSGKTLVLNHLEGKQIDSSDKFIRMKFDSAGIHGLLDKSEDIEKITRTRYEILFCLELLSYIKNYYKLTYDKYFIDLHNQISTLSEELNSYINNYMYTDIEFKNHLDTKPYAEIIIDKMKQTMDIDTLGLGIDHFDHISNSNPMVQKILSEYFDLFDKVIITSDDKNISKKVPNGYQNVETLYNKDDVIVKEIIRRRIDEYSISELGKDFDHSMITDDMYKELIKRTDGNLKIMLNIIYSLLDYITWNLEGASCVPDAVFDRECYEKIEQHEKMMKMASKPKFHL